MASGTSVWSGSPYQASRSASASLADSTTTWMSSALVGSVSARSKPSSTRSCWSRAGPWPQGPVLAIVRPNTSAVTGASSRTRQVARSSRGQQAGVRPAGGVHRRLAHRLGDPLGDEPGVERRARRLDLGLAVRAGRLRLVDQRRERAGQHRVAEPAAGRRAPSPFGSQVRAEVGQCSRKVGASRAIAADAAGSRGWPSLGVADRRGEHVAHLPGAVAGEQVHPGAERAGDHGREPAGARHHVQPEVRERLGGGGCGGGALAAQHERLAAGSAADQRDVAAEPVEVRLDDVQHETGCDRGVERVAAALEHAHPGGGGEPVAGGHHPQGADDLRTSGGHVTASSHSCAGTVSRPFGAAVGLR